MCASVWLASWCPPISGSARSPSPATRPVRCSSARCATSWWDRRRPEPVHAGPRPAPPAYLDQPRRFGVGITPGQPEQSIEQRGTVGHRHRWPEDTQAAPLLGVWADLLPETGHQIWGQRKIAPDQPGDLVGPYAPAEIDLPEGV